MKQESSTIGNRLCPNVFYQVPGDRSGRAYSFRELPFDRQGRRLMGCKIVNADPCVRCGRCNSLPMQPELYVASAWALNPVYLRLPGACF